jgi:hypothetical protein
LLLICFQIDEATLADTASLAETSERNTLMMKCVQRAENPAQEVEMLRRQVYKLEQQNATLMEKMKQLKVEVGENRKRART